MSAVEFWSHLEKLLAEFSDENAALLAHRDELQAAIDEWYEGGCKEDQEGFLKRIGSAFLARTNTCSESFL